MTPEERANKIRELKDFWARAHAGDKTTVERLRMEFDISPDPLIALFRGDMAERVLELVLDRVAGRDLPQREAIKRKTQKHRKELAGPFPSAIESMLAERCALLYLAVHETDMVVYMNMDEMSMKLADFCERRRDRANRRLLAGLKALALVREKQSQAEERTERAARFKSGPFEVGSAFNVRMTSAN
jgi:hypothetical protein